VLYVDAENGRSVMKERCDILNIAGTRMRFWCLDDPEGAPPPLDNPIYFHLAKKYRPVFIFDPLREFFSGADKGETNIEAALLPTLRAAKQIAHRCGVPIILVHHSSDKDSRNTYLHSIHIRGAIDAGYFVKEKKADPKTPHLHVLLR
jgi:RecA-family ATPase